VASAPTVLIRTPYGRGVRLRLLARAVAEQGFHVVVQSCRGTYDSGGDFEPMRHERDDGLDTIDWLRRQPWYSGELCTFGPSYVGFTQWALAADAGPDLKAMATVVTAADFRDSTYAGGAFSLDTVLTWAALLSAQRGPKLANFVELRRGQPRLHRGLAHLPLREADVVATGAQVAFLRDWLAQPGDDYWDQRGHAVAAVTVPVLMVGGWYDIFLPWQLNDYAALRAAGAQPRLTIGPWTHGSFELYRESLREAVAWFRAHTGTREVPARRAPVRVHLGGADQWLELDDWPPDSARTREWLLSPDAGSRFRYDPADPTPAVGLFVRVCDVTPDGHSWNICDGLVRVTPVRFPADGDGVRAVHVPLWPMAHRFSRGHRVRVQVSGGAHPRFARNPGTGEPLATAVELRAVDVEVIDGSALHIRVLP